MALLGHVKTYYEISSFQDSFRNSTGTLLGHVINVLLLGALAGLHMTLKLETSFNEILNLVKTNGLLKLGIPLNVETFSVRTDLWLTLEILDSTEELHRAVIDLAGVQVLHVLGP